MKNYKKSRKKLGKILKNREKLWKNFTKMLKNIRTNFRISEIFRTSLFERKLEKTRTRKNSKKNHRVFSKFRVFKNL